MKKKDKLPLWLYSKKRLIINSWSEYELVRPYINFIYSLCIFIGKLIGKGIIFYFANRIKDVSKNIGKKKTDGQSN